MKIAVMSDTHDNIWNLEDALAIIKDEKADLIIHCGDFIAPFMLKELDSAGIPVYGVLGNNDGSQYLLTKTALTIVEHFTLFDIIGHVDLDDFKIAFTHQEEVADGLTATRKYDLVCFGHSHEYKLEDRDGVIFLNPGEIMGKNGEPGFCIVNSETRDVTRYEL